MATCAKIAPIVIGRDGSVVPEVVSPETAEFLQGWQPRSFPAEKDEEESERVGRKIRSDSKQCWFNARRVVQTLDDYAGARYVEGYAICKDGFGPIEHGWVVRNNTIIDPTLPDSVGLYFPGLEFVGRGGIEDFLSTTQGRKCRKSPFFFAFGWGGFKSPSMARAYEESFDALRTIHNNRVERRSSQQ